ncbi:hypothetical protein JCM5353_006911 [Sporobolomyces roseus]
MSAPPPKRQRTTTDSSELNAPIFAINLAMDRVLAGQDQFPTSSRLFLDLIVPLQEAHIALTKLQDEQQALEALKVSEPTAPLIAKFHRNLTRPLVSAIREAKDLNLIQRVMSDIEASWVKLDELGIILRPKVNEEEKMDLLVWEFGLPGRAETIWSGSLIKGTLTFPPEHPNLPPKAKIVPPMFHPNVYPSGTIGPVFNRGDEGFEWPEGSLKYESVDCRGGSRDIFVGAFPSFASNLRIPILLNGIRRAIHFPQLEHPAQLDAYTMAKKDPSAYSARIKEEVKQRPPTPQDLLDLEDARKRVLAREEQVGS